MYGLGKKRSKLGKHLDKIGVKQGELPVNKNTATKLCNEVNYDPTPEVRSKVIGYLRMRGYDVRVDDFWA